MARWIKCTTMDGAEIAVNVDLVAIIRPHNRDRGGTGSELMFVSGTPSSLIVKENQEHLVGTVRN